MVRKSKSGLVQLSENVAKTVRSCFKSVLPICSETRQCVGHFCICHADDSAPRIFHKGDSFCIIDYILVVIHHKTLPRPHCKAAATLQPFYHDSSAYPSQAQRPQLSKALVRASTTPRSSSLSWSSPHSLQSSLRSPAQPSNTAHPPPRAHTSAHNSHRSPATQSAHSSAFIPHITLSRQLNSPPAAPNPHHKHSTPSPPHQPPTNTPS